MVAQEFTVDLNKPLVFQVNTAVLFVWMKNVTSPFSVSLICGVSVSWYGVSLILMLESNVDLWKEFMPAGVLLCILISIARLPLWLFGVVLQVGHLGESYQEWVHQPIASREGPRFFESDFWEVFHFLKQPMAFGYIGFVWGQIYILLPWLDLSKVNHKTAKFLHTHFVLLCHHYDNDKKFGVLSSS